MLTIPAKSRVYQETVCDRCGSAACPLVSGLSRSQAAVSTTAPVPVMAAVDPLGLVIRLLVVVDVCEDWVALVRWPWW